MHFVQALTDSSYRRGELLGGLAAKGGTDRMGPANGRSWMAAVTESSRGGGLGGVAAQAWSWRHRVVQRAAFGEERESELFFFCFSKLKKKLFFFCFSIKKEKEKLFSSFSVTEDRPTKSQFTQLYVTIRLCVFTPCSQGNRAYRSSTISLFFLLQVSIQACVSPRHAMREKRINDHSSRQTRLIIRIILNNP